MWNLRPHERLREWKVFRNQISKQDLSTACKNVTHLWSYAPYVNYYLDIDSTLWPDPWTLLYENYYCDLAKSLGMLYTLYLSEHKPKDIELLITTDTADRQIYNLVSVEKGKYILNFSFDEIVNKTQLPKTIVIKHYYNSKSLNLDRY
jgi:hypothetical protein